MLVSGLLSFLESNIGLSRWFSLSQYRGAENEIKLIFADRQISLGISSELKRLKMLLVHFIVYVEDSSLLLQTRNRNLFYKIFSLWLCEQVELFSRHFIVVSSDQSFNLKHSIVALGMIYIIVVTELVSLGHQQTTSSESSRNSSLDVGNKSSISGSRILRIATVSKQIS